MITAEPAALWRGFAELDVDQLYDLLQLRVDVFVVEQHCPYPELDGQDRQAVHGLWSHGNTLAGCVRLLPAGERFSGPSIGRVATARAFRGQGLGHAMMREALAECARRWPGQPLWLAAQAHLQAYYGAHGFQPRGAVYDEDGIPHIDMYRPA